MIALRKPRSPACHVPEWHAAFLQMLPVIKSYARGAFADRDAEAKEECVAEVVANAYCAFARLVAQGRMALAYPTVLARYAIAQLRDHRRVGNRLNIRDVLSPYCQARKGVVVHRLDRYDDAEECWREAVVQDTRTAAVPDVVAFRLDFPAWLASLTRKQRHVAEALMLGHRTSDVATMFALSPARISQLRRELHRSWRLFQHETPLNEESDSALTATGTVTA